MSTPALIGIAFAIVAGFGGLAVIVASLLRCPKCRNAWHLSEMECPHYEIPNLGGGVESSPQAGDTHQAPDAGSMALDRTTVRNEAHDSRSRVRPAQFFNGASVLDKSGQDQIPRQDGPSVCKDGPEVGSHR